MRQARAIGLIVLLSFQRMLRSPLYLASILLMPFLAVLMVGVMIGPGTRPLAVGMADATGSAGPGLGDGALAGRVRQILDRDRAVKVRSYDSEHDLGVAIERGDVLAGLVLPADGGSAVVRVLVDPSRPAGAAARLALVSAADRAGAVVAAARFGAEQAGVSVEAALPEADRLSGRQQRIGIEASYPSGTAERGQYDYGLVGILVLFMFITGVSSGAVLVDSRRRGLVGRMLATELRPGALMIAEAAGRYLTTLVQAAIVLVGGAVVFGIHWGPPVPVAAVVALYGLVGAGAGILVGAVSRTYEQAIIFGTVGAIGMGMLGGCMWPLRLAPPALRSLAWLTPQHWAVDGLLRLVNRSSARPGIGAVILVLGGFAVAFVALAASRLRRVAVL